jgi:hypothetical protein
MEIEIGERLDRRVDLRTPKELSRHFRDHVVESARGRIPPHDIESIRRSALEYFSDGSARPPRS